MTEAELQAMRARLIEAAKSRSLVTYGELSGVIGLDMDDRPQQMQFTKALEQLAEMDVAAGEPLLVSLVIRDDTKAPGRGLFKWAKARGITGDNDDVSFFSSQVNRLYQRWASG